MIGDFIIPEPIVWILIAVIFAIIEAFTMGLTTIWFTIGGVGACLVALAGGSILLQVVVFLVVSIVLLYFTRPLAEKKLKIGHEKNSIDQIIGKSALVTEDIEPYHTGQVKLDGQIWTAVSKHNQDTLVKGEEVRILKVEGVKLIVERKKGENQ
ncbi:MAG: NfeD family protein [Anaerovoracaceae bacterium]|jgi:membrane protein implicated in regulation of membrane protease activity